MNTVNMAVCSRHTGCCSNVVALVWKYLIFCLLVLIACTVGFNLDTDIPVLKFGPPGTYFGYSVAQHFDKQNRPLLLVGAPRGSSGQPGTNSSGALLSCPANNVQQSTATQKLSSNHRKQWCKLEKPEYRSILDGSEHSALQDPYSTAPNMLGSAEIYSKDDQMLGATLLSHGTNASDVLVCAPLLLLNRKRALAQGACYVLDADLNHKRHILGCQSHSFSKGHNDYAVCELGFSAALFRDSHIDMMAFGYPGAKNWKGGLFAEAMGIYRRTSSRDSSNTPVENTLTASSFFGYSTTIGEFGLDISEKHERNIIVAVGAPRFSAGDNRGAVFLMPFDLNIQNQHGTAYMTDDNFHLKGEIYLASSFGYSVCAVDLNADGFHDLIVGAPFFYNGTQTPVPGGAVYVYYSRGVLTNEASKVFHDPIRITGTKNSQFGAAITKLGDLNKDGFEDFAVGAPYAEKGGGVYIFHGAERSEFSSKPSQVIFGEDISQKDVYQRSKDLVTFGWSLSGGTDLDGNGYPDLLVGAFQSDSAVLLRSRPILHIEAGVREEDLTPIDKDNQYCADRSVQACRKIRTVVRLKSAEEARRLRLKFTTDTFNCTLKAPARAKFKGEKGSVKSWLCGSDIDKGEKVDEHEILIGRENRDWLRPLEFQFSVSLPGDSSPQALGVRPTEGTDLVDINRFPVLDQRGSIHDFQVEFDKKCGSDKKCVSDLRLFCSFPDLSQTDDGTYQQLVGDKGEISLYVEVRNKGERAYDARLIVDFDERELERPLIDSSSSSRLVSVGMTKETGIFDVDLGNPLEANATVKFGLKFALARGSVGISRPLKFQLQANTSSEELEVDDNSCTEFVKVIKKANINLVGIADPMKVYFGGEVKGESAMVLEEDIGPNIVHRYVVQNMGSYGVSNVTVHVKWPLEVESQFDRGKWALYLMERPMVRTQLSPEKNQYTNCFVDFFEEKINPLQLPLNPLTSLEELVKDSRVKRELNSGGSSKFLPTSGTIGTSSADYDASQRPVVTQELRVNPYHTFDNVTKKNVYIVEIDCDRGTAKCFNIRCPIDFIEANGNRDVFIRARLWNSTFVEDYSDVDYVLISSVAHVVIDPSQGIEQDNLEDDWDRAINRAYPDLPELVSKGDVPTWIIIVAIFAGIFLLFLIIMCCWWCGFFKRKKPGEQDQLYRAQLMHMDDYDQDF